MRITKGTTWKRERFRQEGRRQVHRNIAHYNFGTFRPVILWQQKITGKWSRQNLSTTFFAEAASDAALEKAHERYERFLT